MLKEHWGATAVFLGGAEFPPAMAYSIHAKDISVFCFNKMLFQRISCSFNELLHLSMLERNALGRPALIDIAVEGDYI